MEVKNKVAGNEYASLIFTVKNDIQGLERFLSSIMGQTRKPDELIVVDGGSEDGTLDMLKSFCEENSWARLIERPGANIAQGRNIAITESQYENIAVTDAGCVLEPDWLEVIIDPLLQDVADVVSGGYELSYHTKFQRCLAALVSSDRDEWNAETFLPSSRSIAFKRNAWEGVGGYPEWLPYAEDTYFDLRLKNSGFVFVLRSDALVHWEARSDIKSLAKQYYRYHHWDMIAGNFLYRGFLTFIFVFGLLLLLVASILYGPSIAAVVISAALAYGFIRYGLIIAIKKRCAMCFFLTPVCAAVILISENVGRFTGLIKRFISKV